MNAIISSVIMKFDSMNLFLLYIIWCILTYSYIVAIVIQETLDKTSMISINAGQVQCSQELNLDLLKSNCKAWTRCVTFTPKHSTFICIKEKKKHRRFHKSIIKIIRKAFLASNQLSKISIWLESRYLENK